MRSVPRPDGADPRTMRVGDAGGVPTASVSDGLTVWARPDRP
ncbi:hypothetical protein [Rhodococcus sp. NPDC059234]